MFLPILLLLSILLFLPTLLLLSTLLLLPILPILLLLPSLLLSPLLLRLPCLLSLFVRLPYYRYCAPSSALQIGKISTAWRTYSKELRMGVLLVSWDDTIGCWEACGSTDAMVLGGGHVTSAE